MRYTSDTTVPPTTCGANRPALASTTLRLLCGLMSTLIVLALPPGAGVALLELASLLAWRFAAPRGAPALR